MGSLQQQQANGRDRREVRHSERSDDRLAIVLADHRAESMIQRIATAQNIAADDFQAWLRHKNANGYEVYISMNALAKNATGRTKADVEHIRHVYLDFDDDGTAAVGKLLARRDLPRPNYLINTSSDKWQIVWKVDGFDKAQAERFQRVLSRQTGADPAATDCSRVLRLPGFFNHKYANPVWIGVQMNTRETHRAERFPQLPVDERGNRTQPQSNKQRSRNVPVKLTQSERDWASAKRALACGEPKEIIVEAIASHRRYDKHNPQYYAEHTVQKAALDLAQERGFDAKEPDR
jgi:hypothetical protein